MFFIRSTFPNKIEEIKQDGIEIMERYAGKEANPLYPVPKLYCIYF
jgi:hypothetical protein